MLFEWWAAHKLDLILSGIFLGGTCLAVILLAFWGEDDGSWREDDE